MHLQGNSPKDELEGGPEDEYGWKDIEQKNECECSLTESIHTDLSRCIRMSMGTISIQRLHTEGYGMCENMLHETRDMHKVMRNTSAGGRVSSITKE